MSGFAALALESLRDAVRRRVAAALVAICVVSVLMLDSCTACVPTVNVNGATRELGELAGAVGVATFVVLSLWITVLAGVLAADHLRQTLEDGSAALVLARPVGRAAFALARLAGALGLALGAGAVLLGAAGFLLATRHQIELAPALLASLACALGCVCIASLAMAASLWLPRLPSILAVFVTVGVLALANLLGATGAADSGLLALIDRLGPPLAESVASALAPWVAFQLPLDPAPPLLARLALWDLASLALLLLGFRRIEIA